VHVARLASTRELGRQERTYAREPDRSRDSAQRSDRTRRTVVSTFSRWYRSNLVAFHAWVEELRGRDPQIGDLDKPLVDAYVKDRMATPTRRYPKGSPFTARAAAVSLKRLGSFLAQDGILADEFGASVLKHVKRTKLDADVRQPLNDDDLDRILRAAGSPGTRDHALLVLAAGTGLCGNELRELRIGDLDLYDRTVTVRPETSKFGRSRTVHFHDAVGRELDRYLRESRFRTQPEAPLFPNRSGACFDRDGFQKVFDRIRTRSGVAHFSAPRSPAHLGDLVHARTEREPPRARAPGRRGPLGDGRAIQPCDPAARPRAFPNPLHKSAFVQTPTSALKRLSGVS
jgi:integrase